ncbi:MAG: chromosome segregation protein ScpA [Sphingobacteriales bacterium]|nr:MAG: chromosome segregation protein ScpA [Sphingobacteriales bacterium]TAF79341.1 MAG: chromosome segregation protein ScpA [Sphingobacteriales bacterium]
MPDTNFEIHLPQFDGPFDLLLFFIERDELDIHAIPIAQITNDFLNYINQLTALNVEVAADFILVAATLMRIKAKTLLPIQHHENENENIVSEQELINRLIAYKAIKQQAENLKSFEQYRSQQLKRGNIAQDIVLATETKPHYNDEILSFDLYKLLKIYNQLTVKYKQQIVPHTHVVVQQPFTNAQQKELITQLIAINKKLSYQQIKNNTQSKLELVYSFLALLEMVHEKLLSIEIGVGFNNFYIRQQPKPLQ